eukprot:SRR837773.6742.p2 GENE.SRR837773.6742~~SRR837773.6742.p2  ORF type:complete len:162 (+),score=86.96 SRR837773.6742:1-486(+)
MSQSGAIEAYLAEIAPRFAVLSPQQRAIDHMYAGIKEDLVAGLAKTLLRTLAVDREQAKEEVIALLDKFFAVLDQKLPEAGFVLGFAFPTVADLVVLNITTDFTPFGAAELLTGYDFGKWKKVAALSQRVREHEHVAQYVSTTPYTSADPFGLREKLAAGQ